MENVNVPELVERLGSDEDAVRKMAVFKLQSNIGDPSFADLFIIEGGLTRLRYLALHASGNTLAYSLTSFARLLEVDKGWECVDQELVERVRKEPDPLPSAAFHSFTNEACRKRPDCRIDCHPSSRQYPPRRHVNSCICGLPSTCWRQPITGGYLWLSCPKTSDRDLPPVLGDAGQSALFGGPCPMRQCAPIDQFPHARFHHLRFGSRVAEIHSETAGPRRDSSRLCAHARLGPPGSRPPTP